MQEGITINMQKVVGRWEITIEVPAWVLTDLLADQVNQGAGATVILKHDLRMAGSTLRGAGQSFSGQGGFVATPIFEERNRRDPSEMWGIE